MYKSAEHTKQIDSKRTKFNLDFLKCEFIYCIKNAKPVILSRILVD